MVLTNIVVVGGGPAGMMASIRAGELNSDVAVYEKNSGLGRKLLLTGKGRCNLTNACDIDDFLEKFLGNSKFLRNAFHVFFNNELMDFFQKRGLKVKIERQKRVFPITDSAASILNILKKEMLKKNVRIIYNAKVKEVLARKKKVEGIRLENGDVKRAEKIILSTGGVSYPHTGSSGEGLDMSRKLGHTIVPVKPGLVPFEIKQSYPKILSGVTLKNIRLKFFSNHNKKEMISDIGELLFTEYGVSGPLILSLSGQIVKLMEKKKVYMQVDLKPALSVEQLHERLLRDFKANPKMSLKKILKKLLPMRVIVIFTDILQIDPNKSVSHITNQERRKIVEMLKSLRLDIKKPRSIYEAMVTQGGIDLKEINPRTMESRIIKNLYFAGEMVDVSADTGGFNLQAAFSTGYLAGARAALT